MADNTTPQSRQEALLRNILGESHDVGTPQSRIEKIWQYALGADGIELDVPQSRLEDLAIQVAELVRNGGGGYTPEQVQQMISEALAEYEASIEGGEYGTTPFTPSDTGPFTEDKLVDRSLTGDYINERVTSIGAYSLVDCQVDSASFPEVTSIGSYAFSGCRTMTSISFPKVETIGDRAFRNCAGLTSVSFPKATRIKTYAFQFCSSLVDISFDDVTQVPTLDDVSAFSGCTSLESLYFPDQLVDAAKAASNWDNYANIIKPLSQKTA